MGVRVRERDGQWWIFATHKNRRKAHKVGQKRAANKLRKELEAILQLQGWDGLLARLGEGPGDTVQSYGRQWLDSPLNDSWAPSTRVAYENAFKNHIVPALGEKRLTDTSRADVIRFIEGTVKAGYTQGQINTNLTVLSGIFVHAMDAEIVTTNPCQSLQRYKREGKKDGKPNPLTEEEARETLENAKTDCNPKAYMWVLLALTSGLRPGEQAGLQWQDIDFEALTLEVERTWSSSRLGKPKSGKARVVDIPPQTVAELKRWRLASGAGLDANKPIFPSQRGNYLSQHTVSRMVKRCAPKPVKPHDLRHTYATLRLEAGDNLFDISGQLGHSNCEITARVYAHWIPSKQKDQVAALGLRLVSEV